MILSISMHKVTVMVDRTCVRSIWLKSFLIIEKIHLWFIYTPSAVSGTTNTPSGRW